VAFTTGLEIANMVLVVEARMEVVEERDGVSTALATIVEELRRHTSRVAPLLPEKSCMIADLEVSTLCRMGLRKDMGIRLFYSRGSHVVFVYKVCLSLG